MATEQERDGDFSFLNRALLNPVTGQPFPGDRIPVDQISPRSSEPALADAAAEYRRHAARQNNFVASPSQEQDYDQIHVALRSHRQPEVDIVLPAFLQDSDTFNHTRVPAPPTMWISKHQRDRTQHATGGVNTILSSTFLNEFRVGFFERRAPGRICRS